MPTVAVNAPKTPVTKGNNGIAAATLPNICKMPPPPPPFVPTPLPNIGQSGKNPKGYSTTVKIEGQPVAIRGSSFDSTGDIASKATGGGIVSNNAEGPTTFLAPGSMNVKIEGKNVQHLGDQMLNNCGPAGSPPNSATMAGVLVQPLVVIEEILQQTCCACDAEVQPGPYDSCASLGEKKHACCESKLATKKGVGGERGYNKNGSDFTNGPRAQLPGESYGEFRGRTRGTAWPDACALNTDGSPAKFYDFKFGCPGPSGDPAKGVPRWVSKDGRRGSEATGLSKPTIGKRQNKKYTALAEALDMQDTTPEPISNRDCP
jgi:uncharacterized Zn-binding protein involved in type VI secretion